MSGENRLLVYFIRVSQRIINTNGYGNLYKSNYIREWDEVKVVNPQKIEKKKRIRKKNRRRDRSTALSLPRRHRERKIEIV